MKKNILLLIPYGGVGGMERLALTFYTRMKKQGYNVKVIKLIKQDDDFILFGEDEIYFSDKDFSEMSFFKRIVFYLSIPFRYRTIIRKYQISVSICFGDLCSLFSSLTFTNENKIASVHALKSMELIGKNTYNRIIEWAYRSTYKWFNKVVCISEAIKDDLLKNCKYAFPNNLKVIYNPHDANFIRKSASEQIMTDLENEIFKTKDVVLFLGRYTEQKAPWHLIRSFSVLASSNSKAHLVFIGSGNQDILIQLQELVKKYDLINRVSFLGQKSNPYPYLKSAKVLALTSYFEGTPNVIIESIAVQTPIVSTDCTKGIWELMCVDWEKDYKNLLKYPFLADSGYITPSMFENDFNFDSNSKILEGEIEFSEAMKNAIETNLKIENRIRKHSEELLGKYDVDYVIKQYLQG